MFRYTNCMMSFAYDRYLKAEGMHWRDLFDMVCSDCSCLLQCLFPAQSVHLLKSPT